MGKPSRTGPSPRGARNQLLLPLLLLPPAAPVLPASGPVKNLFPTHGDSISRAPPEFFRLHDKEEETARYQHSSLRRRSGTGSSHQNLGEKISNYLNI